jgi:predicted metalloendopeptidase
MFVRVRNAFTIAQRCWRGQIESRNFSTNDEATLQTSYHVSTPHRIDNAVNPCDNFYDFACGKFIQDVNMPDENVAVDSFTKLKESIDSKVYMMLLNDAGENSEFLESSKELFKTCLERNR